MLFVVILIFALLPGVRRNLRSILTYNPRIASINGHFLMRWFWATSLPSFKTQYSHLVEGHFWKDYFLIQFLSVLHILYINAVRSRAYNDYKPFCGLPLPHDYFLNSYFFWEILLLNVHLNSCLTCLPALNQDLT